MPFDSTPTSSEAKAPTTNAKLTLQSDLEAALADGTLTSKELDEVMGAIEWNRAETDFRMANLKELINSFGLRLLRRYKIERDRDLDRLTALVSAFERSGALKKGVTIEKVAKGNYPAYLHYDEATNTMRTAGFFENLGNSASETRVTVTDALQMRFVSTVPVDADSRTELTNLANALAEVESSGDSEQTKARKANTLLSDAFSKNPFPENIRVHTSRELPKLIAFLEAFSKRTAPTVTTPIVTPVPQKLPDAVVATSSIVGNPVPRNDLLVNAVFDKETFTAHLRFRFETSPNVTLRVKKHLPEIEQALNTAPKLEKAHKTIGMLVENTDQVIAFQEALGMPKPCSGTITGSTIKAMMELVGSNYRLEGAR